KLFQFIEEIGEIVGVGGLPLLLGEARVNLQITHVAERILDALKLAEAHADALSHRFQAGVGEVFVPLVREDIGDKPHLLGRQFERALVVEHGAWDSGNPILQNNAPEPRRETAARSWLLCRRRSSVVGRRSLVVPPRWPAPVIVILKIRHEKTSMPY